MSKQAQVAAIRAVDQKIAENANCKCCTRHQRNRPNKWWPWEETPRGAGGDCRCPCRFENRTLCRVHPDDTKWARHETVQAQAISIVPELVDYFNYRDAVQKAIASMPKEDIGGPDWLDKIPWPEEPRSAPRDEPEPLEERPFGWWLDSDCELTDDEVEGLMCSVDGYGNVC